MTGIRLSVGSAASRASRSSNAATRALSRRARVARRRAIWRASTSGETRCTSTAPGSAGSTNLFTPITGSSPEARRRACSYAESAISRWNQPVSIAFTVPPSASTFFRMAKTSSSMRLVRLST